MNWLLTTIILLATPLHAAISHVQCYGDPANPPIIYLHGKDTQPSNHASKIAKKTVINIAKKLGYSLSTPRSNMKCKSEDKYCWNLFNKKSSVQKILKEIVLKSKKCFRDQINIVYIGFSNAGYFLNRAITHCLLNSSQLVISIGSDGFVPQQTQSLQKCASQVLMVGNLESIQKKAKNYVMDLKKHSANAHFVSFRGGHQIPHRELLQFLKIYKKNSI